MYTTLRIVSADFNITYESGGPAYLGPTSQSLCQNCPITTRNNTEFTLNITLNNSGGTNYSIYIGTSYIGCDPPFYLESVRGPPGGQPFAIAGGQSMTIQLVLWPDRATSGNWTFYGSIQAS